MEELRPAPEVLDEREISTKFELPPELCLADLAFSTVERPTEEVLLALRAVGLSNAVTALESIGEASVQCNFESCDASVKFVNHDGTVTIEDAGNLAKCHVAYRG